MNWQKYWVAAVTVCALSATALDAQAVELRKCEWLADEAYSQTWLRDAGVTFTQLRIQIRHGDAPPEVKQGQIALSRYVYAHTEKSPDDMADDLLQDCQGYNQ